jgi:hypothetical protein
MEKKTKKQKKIQKTFLTIPVVEIDHRQSESVKIGKNMFV